MNLLFTKSHKNFCNLLQNIPYYLSGILLLAVLKYYYGQASAADLVWLLTPLARLVSFLGGVSFLWEKEYGYISHDYHFIIAPSCSGMRFLMLLYAMLLFSFLHRFLHQKSRLLWSLVCFPLAYILTLSVNSVRITLSIFLPPLIEQNSLMRGLLSPESFHTLLGVVLYVSALLLINIFLENLFAHSASAHEKRTGTIRSMTVPVFWYLCFVLFLPFCSRLLHRDLSALPSFAALALSGCLIAALCALPLYIVLSQIPQHKGRSGEH